MLISLSEEQMQMCYGFSIKCAENQQQIEFGQSDTVPRSIKEIGRDNLIGKIAEVAFAEMLKICYGIVVHLDFEYYPRGEWDGQDTIINGWRIDIKGTRQGGKWMLIEWSKLSFRQNDNDLSHIFVMTSVEWNRDTDTPTGKVDIVGSASINKLRRDSPKTCVLMKGDYIPGTKTRLQADNFAIHFNDLYHDWDIVIKFILNNKPPDLKGYPNPYTGK